MCSLSTEPNKLKSLPVAIYPSLTLREVQALLPVNLFLATQVFGPPRWRGNPGWPAGPRGASPQGSESLRTRGGLHSFRLCVSRCDPMVRLCIVFDHPNVGQPGCYQYSSTPGCYQYSSTPRRGGRLQMFQNPSSPHCLGQKAQMGNCWNNELMSVCG